MRIFEVYTTNDVVAKINKIKLDFDRDYNNLVNLIEYLKSGKCPYVYKDYLVGIKNLEQRINKFLELGDLLDWSDPDIHRFKSMADTLKLLINDLQK